MCLSLSICDTCQVWIKPAIYLAGVETYVVSGKAVGSWGPGSDDQHNLIKTFHFQELSMLK